MQLCVHTGAAVRHSRGHVDVVLMGHLDAQLALPSLLGELLCDIGLLLRDGGQLDGQLTVQDVGHQQLLDPGGDEGDGALDGVGVEVDHRDRFTRLDDLAVHCDEVALGLTIFVIETPRMGIRRGVVVITKGDLEWKPGLREEIQMFVAGTFLEKAAVVVTSAVDERGIEDLRRILWQMCLEETQGGDYAQRNASVNSFRLPIDRVFSLKGFGTIVTGTLLDGALDMDSSAMLYPKAQLVKVRGIQVHGQNVSRAFPGQRVAVNLAGIGKEEISRGEILAAADSMESTMMADVKLRLLKSGHWSLKSGARVHLYHGAAELICKVILLDREVMKPGEEAVVQLRMEQQTAMKAGDHFVIRFYSPVETIGGGVVENPNALKRKRRRKLGAERRFQTSSDTDLSKEMSGNGAKLVPAQINKTNSIETAGKNYDLNDNNINKNKENELESTPIFIKIQNLYLNSGFIPPLTDEVKSDFSREKEFSAVFFKMVRSGVLVRYDEKHYMHRDIRKKALDMAVTLYKEKGVIKTGEFRDQLGISRKCAITLLEGFDRDRITRMTNGERILITRI